MVPNLVCLKLVMPVAPNQTDLDSQDCWMLGRGHPFALISTIAFTLVRNPKWDI